MLYVIKMTHNGKFPSKDFHRGYFPSKIWKKVHKISYAHVLASRKFQVQSNVDMAIKNPSVSITARISTLTNSLEDISLLLSTYVA